MPKLFLIAFTLLFSSVLFSQKVLTITDPEIEFSLSAPNDWVVQDDGYYYILVIPNGKGEDHMSITYFETHEKSPDDQFEGVTKAGLPSKVENYKLLQTGNEIVDKQPAKWAIFTSTVDGIEMKSILFMFISCGQIFQVQGTAKTENFKNHLPEFKQAITSIVAKRI